jgi:hypothetical protein
VWYQIVHIFSKKQNHIPGCRKLEKAGSARFFNEVLPDVMRDDDKWQNNRTKESPQPTQ